MLFFRLFVSQMIKTDANKKMTFNSKIPLLINYLRKTTLASILVLLSFSVISGQKSKDDQFPYEQTTTKKKAPSVRERLFFGGSIGLMFGTITDIQISPIIGFWVFPRIAIAAGPTYRYYKDPVDATALYGARGYLQLVAIKDLSSVVPIGAHTGIYFHIEDELLSLKSSYWKFPPYASDRFYVNTALAGVGISQQIGNRSSLNFMILWPINDPYYQIYSRPEFRISFSF